MKNPRAHQAPAIEAAVNEFKIADRAQISMACGSGKTLTALWIAQKLNAKTIIIGVPKLNLQSQTMKVWQEEADAVGLRADILCVGSNHRLNRIEGVTATTHYRDIKFFMEKKTQGVKIIITTYQSSNTLRQALRNHTFDLAIIDEAHRTAGRIEKMFNTLLFDQNIKVLKRLFMTATPLNFTAQGMLSMDNPEHFGKCVYSLSLSEAIEKGILTDYKLIVIFVEGKKLGKIVEKKNNRLAAIALALKKAMRTYKMKKIVTFHNSIKKAQKFQQMLEEETNYNIFHINSTTRMADREKIVDEFSRKEYSVITNPRLMGEGVDVPLIDTVVFGDVKNSPTDIIQVTGRALRKHPDKKGSFILLPIFFQTDNEGTTIINQEDLDKVRYALNTIAATDHRLAREIKRKVKGKLVENPIIITPANINPTKLAARELLMEKIKEMSNELTTRTWNIAKRKNWAPFEEAREYAISLKPLGINSQSAWQKYMRSGENQEADIPSNPNDVYAGKGWNGWPYFFDKKAENEYAARVSKNYRDSKKIPVNGLSRQQIMEKFSVSKGTASRAYKRGYVCPNYHNNK